MNTPMNTDLIFKPLQAVLQQPLQKMNTAMILHDQITKVNLLHTKTNTTVIF